MRWTADQAKVITSRGKNLLVAAAAGSGKTTVLVERVMRLVEEGANIDEMLIVTFTRAASSDMREKFRKRFREIAEMGVPHAQEQLERLENASISTLHSFCTDVLKNHFEAAGVDPMFRIIDDAEDKQLTERAMDEALENAYLAGGEIMDKLDFARGPMRVRSLVMDMHAFLKERPDPEAWFENALSLMDGDGESWIRVLEDAVREKLSNALALNEYAISLAMEPEGPNHYAPALETDAEAIHEIMHAPYRKMHAMISAFKQVTPRGGKRIKAEDKTERQIYLSETASAVRKKVKTQVESAQRIVSLDADLSMEDIRQNKSVVIKLFEIAKDLSSRLRAYKEKRCALTFNDLEHYTLKALCDERVSESIKNRFSHVFVDEYQDTSDVQEAIVSKISRENNRFMVGDVKQSIYRFRQAEPKLFLEKYENYKSGGENELIVLKQNFRSRACVIDFVNHIFKRVMHGGPSEIHYDEDAMLYKGRDFEGEDEKIEVHIVDKSLEDEEEADGDLDDLNDAQREGYVIAKRIHEIRAEDPAIKYRDICILTRVRVNALNHLASVLSENGIPAYADASESYFDALEVMEIMSTLHLIVNRRRDIDLISVLRSPIVGLTTRELALIRARQKSGSFFEAALEDAKENVVLQSFFEKIDRWRALSRSMPISRLIRKIATETGFYAYVGALPGGKQRQANIDMLSTRALNYENTVGGSLSEFLEYAALMRARGDGESAHTLSENDDVVRLMTSHKSKGLEFPVVFVSLLGRKFRAHRADDRLTAHRDLGASLMRMDEALETMRDTIARRAIVETEIRQDRAEELRIFYVALTRAQSRLILTGCVRNLSSAMTDWQIAKNHPDMYASALDIVGAAIMSCAGAEAIGAKAEKDAPEVKLFIHSPKNASSEDAFSSESAKNALSILDSAQNGDAFDPKMHAAITWQYPNRDNIQAPVKLTASGLTREITGAFEIPDIALRPEFMSEGGLTANERGTAIHAFLRHVDYGKIRGLSGDDLKIALGEQKRNMLSKGLLSPVQGQAVILSSMAQFFASPIGLRIRSAVDVKREWRFNLRMRASDAIENAPATASVVVQGSIDLCFIEEGEWVLVDYKTDRTDDKEELKARYFPQLNLYARALRSITGKPVKEIILCLIRQNDAISLMPDETNAKS